MGLPGNIVRITDGAQQSLFYDDAFVAPANNYTYDAIYRLIAATGREHASNGDVQVDHNDQPIRNLPLATDPSAARNYEETYQYDVVGNILEMFHDAGSGAATWTRTYTYVSGKNQLASHNAPGPSTVTFGHDAHGNMIAMPHLAAIDYTPFDQMRHADLGGGGDSYYAYDSGGTRIRKVIDTGINLIKERIYLGSFEIYREIVSGTVDKERQTLHVLDGVKRIAMVETLTIDDGDSVSTPEPMQRYQLGNHLGSALLELDETGLIVSYEEYHPYGSSAYRSARSGVEVSARRYRYVGMERDDETGLYLMGARYYACWLGRWTSADPMGIGADGPGLYNYVRGSPIVLSDPSGEQAKPPPEGPPPAPPRDIPLPPGFECGRGRGPCPPPPEEKPKPRPKPPPPPKKEESAPPKKDENRVPQELLDAADAGKIGYGSKAQIGSKQQSEFAIKMFLYAVDELVKRGMPRKNALLLLAHAGIETMWGKTHDPSKKESRNPNEPPKNYFSFQPLPAQEAALTAQGVAVVRESRANKDDASTDVSPTPHYTSIRQTVASQLDIAYGIGHPDLVVPEQFRKAGEELAKSTATPESYGVKADLGAIGNTPKYVPKEPKPGQPTLRSEYGRGLALITSALQNLPEGLSAEAKAWANRLLEEIRPRAVRR